MVGVLLLLDRRFRFKPPALFALYVSLYTFGRFFEELLRIDPSHHFAGLRLNAWVSSSFRRSRRRSSSGGSSSTAGARKRCRRRARPTGPTMAIPRGRR